MNPFIGMIAMFGFNFPPKGWAFCSGQFLSIAQNQALFALLGTTYGGNGVTTFALPDLRGRVPIGFGQGGGLSNYTIGEASGSTSATLSVAQMPMHNHTLMATSETGDAGSPEAAYLANTGNYDREYKTSPTSNTKKVMHPAVMANAGNSQPFNKMQPYLVVNYSIAINGIFPSRN